MSTKSDKSDKVVIFDMDETLGTFGDIGILWYVLKIINPKFTKNDFFELLDIYPEYLRPQILEVLEYLKEMKKQNKIDRVIIFTNNNGKKSWSLTIKDYFNYKLGEKLIDQVVAAYKIGNIQIERHRTSHYKKYTDIVKSCRLNKNTKICFLDDQRHPYMLHKNVYYMLIEPYTPILPREEVLDRFIHSRFISFIQKQNQKNMILSSVNHLPNQKENDESLFHSMYNNFQHKGVNIQKNIEKFVEKF